MSSFGQWRYTSDRAATVAAYGRADRGGVDSCGFAPCRNFRLARQQIFPTGFLELLESLGIDSRKDSEVYHVERWAPGQHGGWYHFVGSLVVTGDFPMVDFGAGFKAWMCRASAPRLTSLEGMSVVQLEFEANKVPWLLEESEPD